MSFQCRDLTSKTEDSITKKKKEKKHKNPPNSVFIDEMLPVSLRYNISIVHLFLFTLIPKHTPKEEKKEKKIKQFPYEQISVTRMVPPDQQLTVGNMRSLWNLEYNNCFKQYFFIFTPRYSSFICYSFFYFFSSPPL